MVGDERATAVTTMGVGGGWAAGSPSGGLADVR
jgi:hypothetical protein